MTSEIRANTLKNRVGLGTVSFTNTGFVVSGIVTANSFSGPLTSTSIDLNGDLDVDGHTNLDNVSIAGIVTATDLTVEKSGNLNVNIKSTGGWGALEVGGATAGYIDIKKPFSDDFDLRFMVDGSGTNYITSNAAPLKLNAQGATGIELGAYGAPSLKYNNDTKLVTTSAGVSIPKDLDVDGHTNLDNVSIAGVTTFSEDTKFIGAMSGRDLQWDKSDNSLEFLDYTTARFGTDNNLTIYHNAGNNNSYISENGVGSLLIQASDLYLTNTAGEYYVICATDGRVQLNFNNNEKLVTTNTGIKITSGVSGSISNILQLDQNGNNNEDEAKKNFKTEVKIKTK